MADQREWVALVGAYVTKEIYDKIQAYVEKYNVSISDVVRMALVDFFERKKEAPVGEEVKKNAD